MALILIIRWGEHLGRFAGSDENTVVDGDFAATENELRTALKSLREAGINIVAIHSHVSGEEPRITFFHYWGRGPAQSLAQSEIRASASVTRRGRRRNRFTPSRLNHLSISYVCFHSSMGRTSLQTSYI